jgi:hypothetical protein
MRAAIRKGLLRSRTVRTALIVLGALTVVGIYLDRGLDRPLRDIVERRLDTTLVGYSARIGHLDFHLMGLSMDLEQVVVLQDAHPDPPVVEIPRLRMSVHWTDLIYFRLVADALFVSPTVRMNLVQLTAENRDPVPITERGWQHALESIYP